MKKYLALVLLALFSIAVQAQTSVSDPASLELAKATLAAHGGDKLNNAKGMILRGAVEVSAPSSTQTLPASFAIVVSGEKYRFEIQSTFFNFQQIFDGLNTSTSMPGLTLPPVNQVGLFVLPRISETGYVVSKLPETSKKKNGFRITSPDGYFSDYVVDAKTSLVKEYSSSYDYNGQQVTTSVAIDKYKDIGGVLINEKFSQRLDLGQITTYANFNAKEILINPEITDDVFTLK